MSDLNTLVYQFLEKAAPSTAEAFKETASNIADAPATPTLTELVENHMKRGRDGGDTSSAAAAPAAKRVKQDSNSDSGSSGVPAQGGVALTAVEKAQNSVDSLEEREKELRKLMGVVGDIQDDGHQITDVALKRRLWACNIVLFKNVLNVLEQLQVALTSVNKQLESARPDLAVVRKQTAGELAERYEPKLREKKTLAKTPYRGAEEAKAAVMPYIKGALRIGTEEDDEEAWNRADGKDVVRIFATVGQMGKGKSRLQYELCKQEAIKTDFGDTHVNFVRLTHNEGCSVFPGETEAIFGQNLLMCTGMDREDAQRVRSFEEAVELLYRKLSWPSDKERALVVCVDGFLTLPAACKNPDKARADLLRQLLRFQQDSCVREGANRVVFLFAAVTREMLKQAQTASGRELCVSNVPTLDTSDALDMLFELRPDLRDRYENDPQFELLVHLCLPRPKALFSSIPNAYPTELKSVDMAVALYEIGQSSSLLTALDFFGVDDVRSWLTSMSLHSDDEHKASQKQWGVTAADGSLDPLTLRYWCEVWSHKTWEGIAKAEKILPVARYLREAYIADTKVNQDDAKVVAEVLYNFEAAKRASYNRPFTLSEYYRGSTIKGGFENVYVFAYSAAPKDLVKTVTCFEKKSEVLKLLKVGCVVVSMLSNEAAIEYLVPFFDTASRKLKYVAAVRAKFSPDSTIGSGYKEICDAVMELPIVKFLQGENVTCFPVIFSTSHGDNSAGEVERGVLYNETAMFEFTKCLGPLRLQREKASKGQIGKFREIHAGQTPRARTSPRSDDSCTSTTGSSVKHDNSSLESE